MSTPIEDRIHIIWPDASVKDVMQVGPLGSRQEDNVLLYWRTKDRVSTGMVNGHACFEGSMLEFEAKVKTEYTHRVGPGWMSQHREKYLRQWDEYNRAIRFLKDLPKVD